ncbi:MAG: carboxypeptidase M32 [Salinigranum sp.]
MATDTSGEEAPDAYARLVRKVKRINNVGAASEVLSWDQEVMMPEGGTPARAQQLSTLSGLQHELLTEDELGDLLDELDGEDLDGERAAVVREVRREYERAVRVPTELIEEISTTTSESLPVWERAREEDDWSAFAPYVEKLVDLKRQYAEHIDPDEDPYAVLFADYEPYLPLSRAEEILEELRETLVPMIAEIRESETPITTDAFASRGPYDVDEQEELVRRALTLLGYPWERGRLDTSSHPFSTGNQFDARLTTRFKPDDPIDALTSTIHEFGHATYTLGLPEADYGTPLGEHRGLAVHESQSRLWENHVGRSKPFWELFLPTLVEYFPQAEEVTVEGAYESVNEVAEDNVIRVEADELTYHLHIILRFEIERALVSGDLDVADVPEVWNDKMEEYLGVRPESDAEGCLQDIHWSHGSFGYFPTYSLGSVLAAQLFAAAERDVVDLEAKIRAGEFDPLREWLTENVHRYGQRYETNELVRKATGEDFSADAFVDYVTGKYGDLYGLDSA